VETSAAPHLVRVAGEERAAFFKDGTNAQDCCRPCDKRLVFWERMFDTMISEHYRLFSVS
jgi:hypothetical protein